jgi:hypothetical protein
VPNGTPSDDAGRTARDAQREPADDALPTMLEAPACDVLDERPAVERIDTHVPTGDARAVRGALTRLSAMARDVGLHHGLETLAGERGARARLALDQIDDGLRKLGFALGGAGA